MINHQELLKLHDDMREKHAQLKCI